MNTITITIPQVKINLNIDDLSFDTLEQMVFEITQRIGRRVLEKALFDIDDKLRNRRPRRTFKNTGKRAKYFLTRLGDIRYRRTRYVERLTGKTRYLLNEKLGIKINQRISLLRAKVEIFLASVMPYRGARENIRLLAGYGRSHEALRQSVLREAGKMLAHEKHELDNIKRGGLREETAPPAIPIAYMETDATHIRLQRKRKRTGKMYKVRTQRRRRKRRSIEVKLGIGYTDKVKRYKNGRGKGLRLKDKFTYAGIGKGATFMENLSLIAEKRMSLSKAKAIIFGGDGGSYITSGIKDYFAGAVYVLSKFHLKRNIKRALPARSDMQARINALIKKDKIDTVLMLLGRIIARTKNSKQRTLPQDLFTYIRHNREGINSLKRISDTIIRDKVKGAGAMESNIDKFIAHRFKKRGMSWSVRGALSLIKVKETIANGEWDRWWCDTRDERIEIDRGPLKQLSAKALWKTCGCKSSVPLVEATIPALHGPDRNEPWAKVLRQLQAIDYYKQGTG